MFFDYNNNIEMSNYSSLPPKKRITRDVSFHRPWAMPTPTSPPAMMNDYGTSLGDVFSQLSPMTAAAAAALLSFPTMYLPTPMTPEPKLQLSSVGTPASPVSSDADSGFGECINSTDQPLDLSTRPPTSLATIAGHYQLLAEIQRQQLHQQQSKLKKSTLKLVQEDQYRPGIKRTCPSEIIALPISPPSSMSSTSSHSSSMRLSPIKPHLECCDCHKQYTSQARYRAHCRRHDAKQMQRYKCESCHKCFVQRSSLRTHERIHTGEKPYHCTVCNERFGDFSTFTKHRRTHTGEKPYACPVCRRTFSQSGNMHRHLKVVHSEEDNQVSANLPPPTPGRQTSMPVSALLNAFFQTK